MRSSCVGGSRRVISVLLFLFCFLYQARRKRERNGTNTTKKRSTTRSSTPYCGLNERLDKRRRKMEEGERETRMEGDARRCCPSLSFFYGRKEGRKEMEIRNRRELRRAHPRKEKKLYTTYLFWLGGRIWTPACD